jgi:hypothetical protein
MNGTGTSVLPHSLELEQAILNAPLEWGRCIPGLEPRDFYRDANRMVATAIVDAQRQDLSPEYQVVRQMLRERNQIDAVGEIQLHELARDGVRPSDASLAANLRQLRELARKRQVATLILRYANDPTTVDVEALARDLEALRVAGSVGVRASFRSAKDLADAAERVDWIVRGLVARGAVTELTGQVKRAGKTTLIAYIVACILDGLPCLGDPAQRSPVVFLTEQPDASFREVLRRSALLDREDLRILSYWDVKGQRWPTIADLATREAERIGAALVVVDTLPQFAGIKGDGENNSGDALTAMEPLQVMAHRGLAVLSTRHARKSGGEVGEDGRGSSAFTGGADIVLSLKRPEGKHRPTIRVLEGLSRFEETPAKVVVDRRSFQSPSLGMGVWKETFVVLGDSDAVAHDEATEALDRHLPTDMAAALTMAELLNLTGINAGTLDRALKAQWITRTGRGGKKDPYRYYRIGEVDSFQTSNPREEMKTTGAEAASAGFYRA